MARRKKMHGAKRRGKRRKVGASKSGMFEILIGTVLGAVVGRVAYTSITLPNYVMGVSQVLVGGGGAYFMGDMPLARGLGLGLLASGAEIVATEVIPSMSGIDMNSIFNPQRAVSGYRDVPKVGANFPKPATVSGSAAIMGRLYKNVY